MSRRRRVLGAVATAAALAFSPSSARAEPGPVVLRLSEGPEDGRWPAEAEDLLGGPERAVVIERSWHGDPFRLAALLDRYRPRLLLAARAPQGLPAEVEFLPDPGPAREAAAALRARLGAPGAAAPRPTAASLRRRAEAHLALDDLLGARLAAQRALELSPRDEAARELLERVRGLDSSNMARWLDLRVAERLAASPRLGDGERARALRELAALRAGVGDIEGARAELDRAAVLAPRDGELAYERAALLRESPQRALGEARRAARLAATPRRRAAARSLAAELLLDSGEEAGARAELALALAERPEDLDALALLARASEGPRARAAAERAERAAERAPAWRRSASRRLAARVWSGLGLHARAAAALRRALAESPEDLHALEALVQLRLDAPGADPGPAPAGAAPAEPEAGEEALQAALRADPEDFDALRRLLASRRAAGRAGEAVALAARLNEAARGLPAWQQPDALRLAAWEWIALGETVRLLRVAGEVEALDARSLETGLLLAEVGRLHRWTPKQSESAHARVAIAHARAALGDESGAEASLDAMLALDPRHLPTLAARARLGIERGDAQAALPFIARLEDAAARATAPERASALRLRAEARVALGDAAGAEDALRRALALIPAHLQTRLALARLLLEQGRPADALPFTRPAAEAQARDTPVERAAAAALAARALSALGDEAGAEASLRESLRLDPGHEEALAGLARLSLARGDAREALRRAGELLERAGTPAARASAHEMRAHVRLAARDARGAREDLERALALAPRSPGALEALARLLRGQGLAAEARPYARRLAESLEGRGGAARADAEELLAALALELGEPSEALAGLDRALSLAPEHMGARRARARLRVARADARGAAEDAERLVRDSRAAPPAQRAEAALLLARARLMAQDGAGAERALSDALAAAPAHPEALAQRAQLRLQAGRAAQAVGDATALVEVSSAAPAALASALRLRARAREALGEREGARADRRAALAADPGDLDSLWRLAGDAAAPREALAVVEAHAPHARARGPWLVLRGLARAAAGDRPGAARDLAAGVAAGPREACFGAPFRERAGTLDTAYFDACLERFPAAAELRADRGVARYRAGDAAGALADLRRAAEQRPGLLEARLSLAAVLLARGQRAEALSEAEGGLAAAQTREGPAYERLTALRDELRAAGR